MPIRNVFNFDNLSLQDFDSDAELIPLLTPEDEAEMNNEQLPQSLPILPLRNTVLFPGVVIPISAGRDKSIKLINDANADHERHGREEPNRLICCGVSQLGYSQTNKNRNTSHQRYNPTMVLPTAGMVHHAKSRCQMF